MPYSQQLSRNFSPQRFRNIAAAVRISDLAAADLKLEKLIPIIATHRTRIFLDAVASGVDFNDPKSVWELLGIDAIIRLENNRGESIRVAIALRSSENKAFSVYSVAKSSAMATVRQLLDIGQYWVICVSNKHFPSKEEWIDILYSQIDLPVEEHNCQLIKL